MTPSSSTRRRRTGYISSRSGPTALRFVRTDDICRGVATTPAQAGVVHAPLEFLTIHQIEQPTAKLISGRLVVVFRSGPACRGRQVDGLSPSRQCGIVRRLRANRARTRSWRTPDAGFADRPSWKWAHGDIRSTQLLWAPKGDGMSSLTVRNVCAGCIGHCASALPGTVAEASGRGGLKIRRRLQA